MREQDSSSGKDRAADKLQGVRPLSSKKVDEFDNDIVELIVYMVEVGGLTMPMVRTRVGDLTCGEAVVGAKRITIKRGEFDV